MTIPTIMKRLALLEARVAELESAFGDTLYRLRRDSIGQRITLGRLADAAGVQVATDDEIDAVLEGEG